MEHRLKSFLSACLVVAFGACMSDPTARIKATLHHMDIPELGVTLMLPGSWNMTYTERGFYQVVASGIAPNGSASTIEFRSLPNRLRDTSAKVLFANGWYQSVRDNYPTWTFVKRGQAAGDVEGTFEFDGRFETNGITFRRIGRLRFRDERVHAIYYTTQHRDEAAVTTYFDVIDSQHKFYKPSKESAASRQPVLLLAQIGVAP